MSIVAIPFTIGICVYLARNVLEAQYHSWADFRLPENSQICLLGKMYDTGSGPNREVSESFITDFRSRVFRTSSKPVWDVLGSYDAVRQSHVKSMQMLFAESLLNLKLGREWRRDSDTGLLEQQFISRFVGDSPDSCLSTESLLKRYEEVVPDFSARRGTPVISPGVFRHLWLMGCEQTRIGVVTTVTSEIRVENLRLALMDHPDGVIVLSTRFLGIESFDVQYIDAIIKLFKSYFFRGMVAWKGEKSFYVPAVSSDHLFVMDPTSLPFPSTSELSAPACSLPTLINWTEITPHVTFGFVLENVGQTNDFVQLLESVGDVFTLVRASEPVRSRGDKSDRIWEGENDSSGNRRLVYSYIVFRV
jgi:hypothetical protein